MFIKLLIKLISFFKKLLPINKINNHKYLNKNQVTNLEIVINSLKNRGYYPTYIYDIGCFQGIWTQKILKIFDKSFFFLFDANSENDNLLQKLQNKFSNIQYKITLLSDDNTEYNFFKMKSGSSIFEEQTSHPRQLETLRSTTLSYHLTPNIKNSYNNLIKIDAQGSEIKILKGLGEFIKHFEIIILEVSLHQYNKDAPLFDEVMNFMNNKNFSLYDIYDLKRLGNDNSFLIQFDCIFIRKNSSLLKVKF